MTQAPSATVFDFMTLGQIKEFHEVFGRYIDWRTAQGIPQAASDPTDGPYSREVIAGAVARGWCHKKNSAKVMDSDLAFAIVDEVMQLGINEPMQEPTDAPSVCQGFLDKPMPNPTAMDLVDPLFNAIWNATKTWDVNVPEYYDGYYCGLNGSHVMLILEAVRAAMAEPPAEGGSK